MDLFKVPLEEFKKMVAELSKAIDRRDEIPAIEEAWKCVSLHYLNFEGPELDVLLAQSYFEWISRKYVDWSMGHVFG